MDRVRQRTENRVHDAGHVGVHIAVRDPQRVEAVTLQNRIPNAIMPGLAFLVVSAAIDLDDEAMAEAHEIKEIAAKGRLSAKVMTPGPQVAQIQPQPSLLRRQ
jgi:hypothetical protein